MKLFLTVVGTLCLAGAIQAQSTYDLLAQSTVSLYVAGNTSLALAAINQTIAGINATIEAVDLATLAAVTTWKSNMMANLTSLVNRFINYTGTIGYTAQMLNSSMYSSSNIDDIMQQLSVASDTYSIPTMYNTVVQRLTETGDALIQAAYNLTSQASCTNNQSLTCLRKYGASLTAAPILLNRFNDCLSAEVKKIANIGVNITTQINNAMISSKGFFGLIQLCNIPTAAAMNASSTPMSPPLPSVTCLETFLNSISFQSSIGWLNYAISSLRYPVLATITFRADRCSKMVQLDILDTIPRVNAAFSNCLVTGK